MGMHKKETRTFVSILGSTGDFRQVVSEDTEGAVRRDYEIKDSKDGSIKKGTKFELVFDSIDGHIADIEIFEGDYGKNLILTMDFGEDAEPVGISVNTATPFGEDLMKKLPNINFNEVVELSPYSFEDDEGKSRRGISIKQNGEKIQSFFYDPQANEGKGGNVNGYPDPQGDTSAYDKDDWKIYFTQARKFLVKYTEEHIITMFEKKNPAPAPAAPAAPAATTETPAAPAATPSAPATPATPVDPEAAKAAAINAAAQEEVGTDEKF